MKKTLAVLMAVCLLFLSACSEDEEEAADLDEGTVVEASASESEAPEDTESPESTEDAAGGEAAAGEEGENPVIAAIERRNSTARDDFTGKEIDEDILWLLGWAATGTNRDGTGYVIPLAMGADPFVSVYLAQESGVRRFSWETNDFEPVSDLDIRAQATQIDLSETVTAIWIFVIETDQVPNDNLDWAYHAIGAMSENQYLVAEEFDVQARYMAAVDADAVRELLELGEEQLPAGVMMMAQK